MVTIARDTMTNSPTFTVVHDPHGQHAIGKRLTPRNLWCLLEDPQNNGLEVTDNQHTFRLYQCELYRLDADGRMRLWRMPAL